MYKRQVHKVLQLQTLLHPETQTLIRVITIRMDIATGTVILVTIIHIQATTHIRAITILTVVLILIHIITGMVTQ